MIRAWKVSSHHVSGYYIALESTQDDYAFIKQTLASAISGIVTSADASGVAGLGITDETYQTTLGEISLLSDSPTDFSIVSDSTHLLGLFEKESRKHKDILWKDV